MIFESDLDHAPKISPWSHLEKLGHQPRTLMKNVDFYRILLVMKYSKPWNQNFTKPKALGPFWI